MNSLTQTLIDHQTGLAYFLGVLLLVALGNLLQLRRTASRVPLNPDRLHLMLPRVSILVPARNESDQIEGCVRSLLNQDYPNFEVLVLDDHSQDSTFQILANLVAGQEKSGCPARLRLLKGLPLPPGWMGKNWACQQLGEAASGDYLLFTDADTRHQRNALIETIKMAQESRCDLLTALPYQEVRTWGEKLTVPTLYWSLFAFFPLWLAYRIPLPFLATGIGQFMLFRRTAYELAGGFSSVHDQGADDIALARRVKATGLRWRLVDGGELLSCRMYPGFSEAFAGLSRSFFPVFGYRVLPFLFIWSWIAIAFLEPPLILVLGAASGQFPVESLNLALLSTFLALLLWSLVLWRFRFPRWTALLYPLHILLAVSMALNSLALHLRGRATWKDRTLVRSHVKLL
jgi:chlorobactene glucosyltransferase